MQIDRTRSCCGVGEISNLGNVQNNGKDISLEKLREVYECRLNGGSKFPFYFWADKTKGGNAKDIADKVEELKLGTVFRTTSRKNSNSGNNITAFLWEIKPIKFTTWYRDYTKPKTVINTVTN